ncbi:MAG TPA: efflux RND transporter periplasmic adaptor subunit [Candidatus Baltobacteraceae bacterium]|jgi:multidrug efflux pump subunit AcrA (membrane-fusion protein)
MKAYSLRLTAAVALLVIVLLAGCGRGSNRMRGGFGGPASPAPIPTAVAHQASVHPTLVIAGIIAPLQNVAISSTLSEPADTVSVNEGDRVRAGQVIAVFDTADLQAQLESQLRTAASDEAKVSQARYTAQLNYGQNPEQVQQARQSLMQAQHTLALDTLTLQRDEQLVSQGYLQQQTYDQQRTTVSNDQAGVRSAQAALNSAITNQQVNGVPGKGLQAANIASAAADAASARATANQIRAEISRATIASPVDGVVINRNLNPGEYPNGRTLFTIQELSHVYAELNASSTDIFRIKGGAQVALHAGGDQTGRAYTGKVVAVLGQVAPGSTNFTVKALVENPGDVLQAGVPVTGTIDLPSTSGTGIPLTAFLDDTRSTVMIAQKGVAKLTHVRELANDGTTSIVTGVTSGTRVIADGQLGLTDGQPLGASTGRGRRGRNQTQ